MKTRTFRKKVNKLRKAIRYGQLASIGQSALRKRRNYKRGQLYLLRKTPECTIANSGAFGGITTVDVPSVIGFATQLLQVGTPTPSIGSGSNGHYDIPFTLKFRLSQLYSFSEITAIADKYKILGVYIRIYYSKTESSAGFTANMPYIQYINDYDDANLITKDAMRERMGVKMKVFRNGIVKMMVRPKPTREIYGTGITSAYELPSKAPWIDCVNADTEHYGVKGVLQNVYLGGTTAAQEVFKFDIAMKVVARDIL